MFKKVRDITVTEKAFEDRADNFITNKHEIITKSIFGLEFSRHENKEHLVSIKAEEPEQIVVKKKRIGFHPDK